jgi:putative membrane-bound dehydrogenase-like protein
MVAVLVVKADTTPAAFRSELEAALPSARKAGWQKFLAQREPEVREKNINVANYEKRPEPLTFQKPYSVKGSMERTQVPADMKLVLFASEPDIMKPIAFAWDARGRLWVCETSDYPHGVKEDQQQGNDRIKICDNGGVIVSQAPNFVFLQDTDGDDKADVRKVILTGWGIRDTHAQTSSLSYGYDNWLRGAVGYSGFAGEVAGEKKNFAMGSYRFTADGAKLEFLHQFSNNTWGYGANAAGDSFGGTANNAPIFFGGIPATAWAKGSRGMSAKRINLVDKAHTITPNFRQVDVMGGWTAAAGSTFIYSAQLPSRLQGKAMVCEPTMKLIGLMDVQPDGAGYVAKDGFSLVASSDEWMSPVFAEVGPDGAIWFADWQNFIIQHNPTPSVGRGGYDAKTGVGGAHENDLRDHARGRIYRIVWDKAGNVAKAFRQHPRRPSPRAALDCRRQEEGPRAGPPRPRREIRGRHRRHPCPLVPAGSR